MGLEKGKYILLSAHREENIDTEKNFTSLFTAINKMAEKYDMPILYSTIRAAASVWSRAASSLISALSSMSRWVSTTITAFR